MKEKLKEIANRAKTIAIAVCGWDEKHFDRVEIDLDGDISVYFSHYYRGDTDYESVYLTEEDMNNNIETTVLKYKKILEEKLKKEQKEKAKEEIKRKEDKEKQQRIIYDFFVESQRALVVG